MEKTTRFMEVMFSNTDEDAAKQVDNDIREAQANGSVDDTVNNLKYEKTSDGSVAITDKENGEVTLAKQANDAEDTYDLIAVPDGELEKFLHPSDDGVHEGNQTGAPDEDVNSHMNGSSVISPNLPNGGLNMEAGHERKVVDACPDCNKEETDEKEFSVYTDNTVVQRIFSDQIFCERIFSDVIETGETAHVGDLIVENLPEDGALKVTDTKSDDAAVVKYDEETGELIIDEKTKNFSDDEYLPLRVVGIEPINHVLVDAPAYTEEAAEELARRLTEDGVENVQIFEDFDEARDYAIGLLDGFGVNSPEDIEEPEQVEYSEVGDIFLTRYYSDNTWTQTKMFSEEINGISDLHDTVMDAVSHGDEIETDEEIVTPIDAISAVIEDKDTGEFTKATVDGEDVKLEGIDKDEAEDLVKDIEVEDNNIEKSFSYLEYGDIYSDEAETRFYSENEDMTAYMERLFSTDSDQEAIEDAIANGDQIETETEVITPIDAKTAVVEDKENNEFTKVSIIDDDALNVHPIDEDEANSLTENLEVEDTDEDEDEEEDEKNYSNIYTNEAETRFFSEHEEMNSYMERLFSEESDQEAIEDAIANGDQIETETEVITPIDAKTAVVEDKENNEFTKATVIDDDNIDVHPISEEEANDLTEGLEVEDTDKDEDEDENEKKFSDPLNKFFAEVNQAVVAPQSQAPAVDPNAVQQPQPTEPTATVEEVEDKALAAVQSIRAAAEEAAATIMDAKAAPAPNEEPNLQEAQFSNSLEEKTFSENANTLVSWLNNK